MDFGNGDFEHQVSIDDTEIDQSFKDRVQIVCPVDRILCNEAECALWSEYTDDDGYSVHGCAFRVIAQSLDKLAWNAQ